VADLSASLVASISGEDRFVRFLTISAVVHVLVAATFLAVAKFPRAEPDRMPLTFELVGEPARGVPGPAAAPAPEPEAPPENIEAPPPEPEPEPRTFPVPASAAPSTNVPTSAPRETRSVAAAPSNLPVGPAAGSPTGDTLSVGGQGGAPSAMNLWLSRVKFQVEKNWNAPEGLSGVAASPEIVFDVARDGRPSRPKLRVKSGNAMLDGRALRAVAMVDFFPPVPSAWQGDIVTVRYVLEYAH